MPSGFHSRQSFGLQHNAQQARIQTGVAMRRLSSEATCLAFISCCTASQSVQPQHLLQLYTSSPSSAVELPAACRKALSVHEGRLKDFVLQQMTEETPRPSL